jgi:hypothetical protein
MCEIETVLHMASLDRFIHFIYYKHILLVALYILVFWTRTETELF